jgi:hypothetical protein
MVMKNKHRDGRYHFDEPDEEIPDGKGVRVPLLLCDTVRLNDRPLDKLCDLSAADLDRHRPGFRGKPDDDAAARREKSYATYKARLEGAWRSPSAAAERNEAQLEAWRRPGASPGLRQDAATDRAAAYAGYVQRIQNAWRTA